MFYAYIFFLKEDHLDQVVDELNAKTAGLKKQNNQYKKHIDVLVSDRRLQYIYARENRRLPGGKRMRPEIRAYMTNNRRNDPIVRRSVLVPKKIIYKTSPRFAKAKKVSPRNPTKSGLTPRTPDLETATDLKERKRDDELVTDMGMSSDRPRTAKLRKRPVDLDATKSCGSENMIPYSKEPNRSTKRFLDQSFNVQSTERKMSKLKV